jgi:two-component system response regulator (stage 0 sporulation protein F)
MNVKHKILYVDDELINLQLFNIVFSKKYEVLTAENGIKGLEVLNINSDIAVVISDMRMPVMTGLEFIKKSKLQYPEISYFILTGYEITSEIQEALNMGLIIKYFSKPINMSEIDLEIGLALNKRFS